MSEQDLVVGYLDGRMAAWTVVRRLLKAGISVGTAITFTSLLPAIAQGGNTASLERLVRETEQKDRAEAKALEPFVRQVAGSLVRIARGGSETQLEGALIRLSLNAANTNNAFNDLNVNENVRNSPVNVSGNLMLVSRDGDGGSNTPRHAPQNFNIVLDGTVGNGNIPVVLEGVINVNANGRPGANNVNLNVNGNVGELPIRFNVQK